MSLSVFGLNSKTEKTVDNKKATAISKKATALNENHQFDINHKLKQNFNTNH
jgi:hypothetical protein